MRYFNKSIWKIAFIAAGVTVCTGCSRADMNYQIAEAIGTVGMYDGGEPVESPEMQEARLEQEALQEQADLLQGQLDKADQLAAGYWYDEAIEYLESILNDDNRSEVEPAIESYEQQKNQLTAYEGPIAHLCFPTLIENTEMAFDGDDHASNYDSIMITTKEFRAILDSLHKGGYVLVDIHDVAGEVKGGYGGTTVEMKPLYLPQGKKPVIISQDNVNYSEVRNGDGIARKLVLDDNEQVKALYTDDGGHDLVGDYDLIPILDTYVEENPDFSFRGAKGIISVSGSLGMYGYDVTPAVPVNAPAKSDNDTKLPDSEFAKNQDAAVVNVSDTATDGQRMAAAISTVLKKNGWSLACAGYSHKYMNDMSFESLKSDLQSWQNEVGLLTGDTDILFYPYGGEVDDREALNYLKSQGYIYLCGLCSNEDYTQIMDGYVRQTRRFIDGYTLKRAATDFMEFFNANTILDKDR